MRTLTDTPAETGHKCCFPPVVNPQVRILLLGSLPGEASLVQGQYYAHRQNQFWRLMGAILGEDLPGMAYEQRLQTLLRHRLGLWDVVARARRAGSLDSNIRDLSGNDLAGLVQSLPQLEAIAFNGATAARIGLKQLGSLADRYRIIRLPSSSPAFTQSFADKLAAWRVLSRV